MKERMVLIASLSTDGDADQAPFYSIRTNPQIKRNTYRQPQRRSAQNDPQKPHA